MTIYGKLAGAVGGLTLLFSLGFGCGGSSHSVSTPTLPTGATSVNPGAAQNYTTGGAVDSQAHAVQYRFDWGDGTYSVWAAAATASHAWAEGDTYLVRAQARCSVNNGVISNWSAAITVMVLHIVGTPGIPTGPASVLFGDPATYSVAPVTCNQGHPVEYQFSWFDGTLSLWSDTNSATNTTWSLNPLPPGYWVNARARCNKDKTVVTSWPANPSAIDSISVVVVSP